MEFSIEFTAGLDVSVEGQIHYLFGFGYKDLSYFDFELSYVPVEFE